MTLCRVLVLTAACVLVALLRSATAAPDPAVLEAQQKRVAVVEKVAPTVVAIFGPGGGGGGSGVLISPDGYALTNYHVTSGAGDWMKCGLNDGKLYDAVIVGIDPTGDVALIRLLGREDFPHAALGDSDKLAPGDWCYAMGNPFLLATDFQPTVTYGIVSGVHRYQYPAGTFLEYTDCIQTDASINPGNSGGPLFNDDGELVGINGRGSFEKRGRVNSGAGYAISINQIKHFMGHLRSGRIVDHATLGATVSTRDDGAVVVSNILEDSEAYRRGLRVDDEIISFAGRPVRSVNQYKNILGIYPKGWKLPLIYRRGPDRHEVLVRLEALHHRTEMVPGGNRPQQPPEGPRPRPGRPQPGQPGQPPGEPQPGDDPEQPRQPPGPRRPMRPEAKPPEEHKHLFVKKDGYANWYFNQQERDRALQALRDAAEFGTAAGPWTLSGQTDQNEAFTLTLADDAAALRLGAQEFTQPLGGADAVDAPPGTGGLLMALAHFRMLLTEMPFTELYYLGTEPFDGTGELVDVVAGVTGVVETRFYLDPANGALLGLDTWLGEDVDECGVRFGEPLVFAGQKLPEQFIVSRSGDVYRKFNVQRAELTPGERPKPEPPKEKPEADGEDSKPDGARDENRPER
jgi:serine protease Do